MTAPAAADCITLRTGGEIRGDLLLNAKTAASGPEIAIRSLSGATVLVGRKEIARVIRRRPLVEEYETRRRGAADSVAGQWEVAEWCREKSLSKERLAHLQRVVELDPEHVPAHRGLGHVRQQGRWMTPNEQMAARGLVKHKGKQILPQELEVTREKERVSESEKSWLRRVKQWQAWLADDRPERKSVALARLNEIRDPDALSAVTRLFRTDPEEARRLLYVTILSRIEGDRPVVHLAVQSIVDDSQAVREAAISAVRRKDVARALPIYQRALKNPLNLIVNRAGAALGQLGNDGMIPYLIEALVTRHGYRALAHDDNLQVFTDGPDMSSPVVVAPSVDLAVSGGRMPVVVPNSEPPSVDFDDDRIEVEVEKDEENPSVLSALTLLTGQNLGYDVPAWRNWFNDRMNAVGPKKKP